MSSNQPSSSSKTPQQADNAGGDKQQQQQTPAQKETIPQLGALEEDDEFEEFASEEVEKWNPLTLIQIWSLSFNFALDTLDWNETEEDQETHLWEDNWDDEDVEDDFSKQLRLEITKNSGNAPTPMKI
ncbi:5903_t:CDS:2 [Funneliformis caledonium]|uniref:26S proteasome complex subunit SEM1 n=2 Tax=Funneliformis TaxID=1117308 RepID=A0A9N8VDW8_9GLOM|nr:8362_t:CDS:2 [Funneliformis mosseae]CAG8451910.1 5903_t:CDS:2 [Funneliformis caledonium]